MELDEALAREYRAVRGGAGLFDLSRRSRILVGGDDCSAFLDGILSAEIAALPVGQWTYAALLEPKGHYLADLRAFHIPGGLLLDSAEGMAGRICSQLETYRFRARVRTHDLSEHSGLLSLQGPSSEAIASAAGLPVPGPGRCVVAAELGTWVARFSDTAESGLWIWADAAETDVISSRLQDSGAVCCRPEILRILRIEAGEPEWGVDIDETVIPLEAGQQRALSFRKCYPGQEVVARIHFRGHVNRMLRRLHIEGDRVPPAGASVLSEKRPTGAVTSAARVPVGGAVRGLAYVRRETALLADRVSIAWGGEEVSADVLPLPYEDIRQIASGAARAGRDKES